MAWSFGSPPVPGPHAPRPGVTFPVHRPGDRRVGALFLSPQTLTESRAERGSLQPGVQPQRTEMRGRAETPQNYDWGLLIVWGKRSRNRRKTGSFCFLKEAQLRFRCDNHLPPKSERRATLSKRAGRGGVTRLLRLHSSAWSKAGG